MPLPEAIGVSLINNYLLSLPMVIGTSLKLLTVPANGYRDLT